MGTSSPYPQGAIVQAGTSRQSELYLVLSTPSYFECEKEYIVLDVEKIENYSGFHLLYDFDYFVDIQETIHHQCSFITTIAPATISGSKIVKVIDQLSENCLHALLNLLYRALACEESEQERSVPEPATPGSVVWVDFPFSDAQGSKRRPAVVVNSPEYFNSEKALILLMITSRLEQARCPTDRVILEWRLAGLREESAVRCRPSTVLLEDVEFLGRLHPKDFIEVMSALRDALGI